MCVRENEEQERRERGEGKDRGRCIQQAGFSHSLLKCIIM